MTALEIDVGPATSGVLTVRVSGDLDMHTAHRLREKLVPALDASPGTNITLDLGGLTFADSSGLSALIAVHKRAAACGGQLTLSAAPHLLRRMLSITGLDRVFTMAGHTDAPTSGKGSDARDQHHPH